ncbi:hypothetical protein PoB_003211200 [Plakobranchus ocellatus]|uniref:C2H2-type domain-containing protein n=1 Tax=Plakobranchus ocellatus TaxID=259542 RepID=A0AAV4AFD8_9GAST|nr:hypothetical protein PoB_003211200 [Plakobranchus ocellatus]
MKRKKKRKGESKKERKKERKKEKRKKKTMIVRMKMKSSTVDSESALRSAGSLLSRVRAPPLAPWPDGGPKRLRSPCCGQVIHNKPTNQQHTLLMHRAIRHFFVD